MQRTASVGPASVMSTKTGNSSWYRSDFNPVSSTDRADLKHGDEGTLPPIDTHIVFKLTSYECYFSSVKSKNE